MNLFRWSAIAFLPVGLLTATIPYSPAVANPFNACVQDLLDSGLSAQQTGVACAEALEPRDLSECVVRITNQTIISAEDAVKNCLRVRRPLELASCVTSINRNILVSLGSSNTKQSESTTDTSQSNISIALDSCRRSLLPNRYSQCVVAFARNAKDVTPAVAMETCLSAQDFPQDLFPSN